MNTQAKLKRDHYLSVAISVVINGGLMLALLHFITLGTQSEPDLSTALVLDTADEVLIEEIEEEIIREEIEIDDLQDLDFNNNDFDIPFESDFTEDIEVINAPADATDVSQLTELLSDIASPVVMHGIMPGRTALAMQQARARFGGSDATEAAVQRALRWLARVQLSDGSWDQAGNPNARNGGTGWTGLALLTFLSNGQTPSSAEYGSTVSRAIRYLVENQTRDGMIWNSSSRHQTYAHAIATYALAEAYTMTNNMLLREPVQRAAQFMIRHQLPDGGFRGPSGYRYDGNGVSDNSVTAWNLQALKAVTIASQIHGFEVEGLERALQRSMDAMMGISFTRNNELHFGYTPSNNTRMNSLITEAGGLCLMLAGRGNGREAQNVIGHISQHIPEWGNTHKDTYGGAINMWYYAIQAIFHLDPDAPAFRRYNQGMIRALLPNQHPEGYWQSFDRGQTHGPVFNTTLAALGLMVYYRYLPTTQADRIQQQPAPSAPRQAGDDDIIRITL